MDTTRPFYPTMIDIDADGHPSIRESSPFAGRISEAELEAWLIDRPELAGEPLLILGSQLAEFAEDRDRLDVLAVDLTGELVLVELKVDESFRVTELQALGYAGAYASMPTAHFAGVLRKHLKLGEGDAATADAKERISAFLAIDDFADWQPSRRVRVKLLAPGFPKRVLKTVKWLGEVYEMPIEAIELKLFQTSDGRVHITIDRLLPIPGDDAFDLTVRETEARQQARNITGTGRESLTWAHWQEMYPDRHELLRALYDGIDRARLEREDARLWETVLRYGYGSFKRQGNFIVISFGPDSRGGVSFALKMRNDPTHRQPPIQTPFPELTSHWKEEDRQWAFHVPSLDDLPDQFTQAVNLTADEQPPSGPMTRN